MVLKEKQSEITSLNKLTYDVSELEARLELACNIPQIYDEQLEKAISPDLDCGVFGRCGLDWTEICLTDWT